MNYLSVFGGTRAAIAMALTASALVVGATFASNSSLVTKSQIIEIQYPDLSRLQPCRANDPDPCAAEAAALAAALANLEAAREAAEEAYQAWSDCVDEHNPDPNPNPDPPRPTELTSVLEAMK